jgi:isocitrate lyase
MAATLLPDAPAAPVSPTSTPGAPATRARRRATPAASLGVTRPYTTADVERLRCSVRVEHTLARVGAERLWGLLTERDYVHALGALTGGQAVQMVKAGLEAIYLSGWQVAADANLAGQTYPDQSLYPANSVPNVARRINQALMRADEVEAPRGAAASATGWRRSWPTPRPGSAGRSTRSSS